MDSKFSPTSPKPCSPSSLSQPRHRSFYPNTRKNSWAAMSSSRATSPSTREMKLPLSTSSTTVCYLSPCISQWYADTGHSARMCALYRNRWWNLRMYPSESTQAMLIKYTCLIIQSGDNKILTSGDDNSFDIRTSLAAPEKAVTEMAVIVEGWVGEKKQGVKANWLILAAECNWRNVWISPCWRLVDSININISVDKFLTAEIWDVLWLAIFTDYLKCNSYIHTSVKSGYVI